MAVLRKRKQLVHVQQDLFGPRRRRPGGGRKPKRGRVGSPHVKRPELQPRFPVHVVMRVVSAVGNLRRRKMYAALREASITAAQSAKIRIVHISIQRQHVHMLVEAGEAMSEPGPEEPKAEDPGASASMKLARGMQGFQISAAKHINAQLRDGGRRRRGRVFADRYHLEVIKTPRQARNTLAYVLNNWRKHSEDRAELAQPWAVDPFSTGVLFPDWKERADEPLMWRHRDTYDPMIVYRPKTWMLREGWKRYGLISIHEVPGPQAPHMPG